jgi:hypothetical protein
MAEADDEPLYASALYATIKQTADITQLSAPEIVTLVASSVIGAEQFANLAGAAKKRVVLRVIAMLLDEIPADRADRAMLRDAVKLLAPSIIDTLVAVAKAAASSVAAKRIEVTAIEAAQTQCQCAIS